MLAADSDPQSPLVSSPTYSAGTNASEFSKKTLRLSKELEIRPLMKLNETTEVFLAN
ncbi:hypothetical protein KIN20_016339 [Parelaphostrongylus tenuis]|uniref:Uncharacterized protein n=1 Tax=Parelaphostrongylus tenuis TaxID=148309 RepID=A0AAD5MGA7_PARTN|nr:hypothetical protein KIN20_016339 [Parelaphostrongylus tenuis]